MIRLMPELSIIFLKSNGELNPCGKTRFHCIANTILLKIGKLINQGMKKIDSQSKNEKHKVVKKRKRNTSTDPKN